VEWVTGDVEARHLGFADLDALLVGARVECTFDQESGLGGGGRDQLDHGDAARQRPSPPVLRDVAE
jgi:hypothetical protein